MAVDLSNFHLTFDDEFNSFSASPNGTNTTWETKYFWGGRQLNGASDYYLDGSVGGLGQTPYTLSNGALDIHAQPTSSQLKAAGVTAAFTTGQIDTHNSFSQEYGYFEMRAQVSGSYGTNSAFWLLPQSGAWPPEIDVTEVLGRDPKTDHITNHSNTSGSASSVGATTGVDLSQGYHTYGLMWTPTTITVYLDGVAKYTTPTGADEHQPMYMLATLGVGGSWAGNPSTTNFSADMKIDYIRAYSSDSAISAVSLQHVSSPDGVDTTPYGVTTADGVLTPPTTPPSNPPPPTGSGLSVRVSEDAYNGNAQFTVSVDGHQVGGTYTATALHAAGQWQDINIGGTYSSGPHQVVVNFINDLYGGTATTDRNLYVQSVTINNETVSHGTVPASNTAHPADGSVELGANGSVTYSATGTATPTPPTTSSGLHLFVAEDAWNGNAQFTVSVDGHQIGGTYTATTSHASGQWQDVAIAGTFSSGPHTVDVHFLNDAWGGTTATDRNLYVKSVSLNGETVAGSAATNDASGGVHPTDGSAAMVGNGDAVFHMTGSGTSTPTPPTTTPLSTIVLHVAEDAWNGDAQFKVLVDGQQVGGTYTATASHAAGQWQDVTLTGDFGSTGPGKVDIQFTNDAWGGTAATDRNLYVQSIDVNGHNFAANTATNTAANGAHPADGSAAMEINGMLDFNINHTAAPTDMHLV
jgi:beta-glucanase (GH16 family)